MQRIAALETAFRPYYDEAGELYDAVLANRDNPPAQRHIGGGATTSHVYVSRDGKLAIKIPLADAERMRQEQAVALAGKRLGGIVMPLVRGRGQARMEQIVGYRYDKPAIGCRLVPGRPLWDDKRGTMSARCLAGALDTLDRMRKVGVHNDEGGGNLFRQGDGLVFIDYLLGRQPMAQMLRTLGYVLYEYDDNRNYQTDNAKLFWRVCQEQRPRADLPLLQALYKRCEVIA